MTPLAPPRSGTTLHLIGDVHAGACPQWRYDALISDLIRLDLPNVAATVQLGDNVENGTNADHAVYSSFRGRLTAPVYEAMGNHDTYVQTEAQWAARFGYPSGNHTVDLPGLRLVFIGGTEGELSPWSQIPAATLTYLAERAAEVPTTPVFVPCHYPLWDTVGGDPALEYTSRQGNFYACTVGNTASSAEILAVLSAHPNIRAWLSGHTHSSITAPGLVVPVLAGSNRIAHVNGSCIYYCGKSGDNGGPRHPVHTSFLTWTGDAVEVRYRNHGAGQWYGPDGNRVLTVTGL